MGPGCRYSADGTDKMLFFFFFFFLFSRYKKERIKKDIFKRGGNVKRELTSLLTRCPHMVCGKRGSPWNWIDRQRGRSFRFLLSGYRCTKNSRCRQSKKMLEILSQRKSLAASLFRLSGCREFPFFFLTVNDIRRFGRCGPRGLFLRRAQDTLDLHGNVSLFSISEQQRM